MFPMHRPAFYILHKLQFTSETKASFPNQHFSARQEFAMMNFSPNSPWFSKLCSHFTIRVPLCSTFHKQTKINKTMTRANWNRSWGILTEQLWGSNAIFAPSGAQEMHLQIFIFIFQDCLRSLKGLLLSLLSLLCWTKRA